MRSRNKCISIDRPRTKINLEEKGNEVKIQMKPTTIPPAASISQV